jgi:hypothetical protein
MKISQLIGEARFEHFAARHVKDAHYSPGTGLQFCHECGLVWPCDTRVLLDAIAVAEADLTN